MVGKYIPDVGHIVWLTFDPQAGHEHAGRRPALVLSPQSYNAKTGVALFLPITNRQKGYPFELLLPSYCSTSGVVLCDQMRNLDWQVRKAEFKDSVNVEFVREALALFLPLITV